MSGTITFKGRPLDGTITFYPVSTGTQAGDVIKDGKYQIAREKGLTPGKYRVSIESPTARRRSLAMHPGAGRKLCVQERIPPEFNRDSKKEIEVTAAGPNEFNFTIP